MIATEITIPGIAYPAIERFEKQSKIYFLKLLFQSLQKKKV